VSLHLSNRFVSTHTVQHVAELWPLKHRRTEDPLTVISASGADRRSALPSLIADLGCWPASWQDRTISRACAIWHIGLGLVRACGCAELHTLDLGEPKSVGLVGPWRSNARARQFH
jgi:hypothetical protein